MEEIFLVGSLYIINQNTVYLKSQVGLFIIPHHNCVSIMFTEHLFVGVAADTEMNKIHLCSQEFAIRTL